MALSFFLNKYQRDSNDSSCSIQNRNIDVYLSQLGASITTSKSKFNYPYCSLNSITMITKKKECIPQAQR